MNQQEQTIAKLNSEIKATVGVSKIHGVGVIAIRTIQKGGRVYANALPQVVKIPPGSLGKLFPEVKKLVLDRWPSVVNGGVIGIHEVRLLSLMNHSPKPNYDPMTDEALCDIMGGEEILENYMEMPNFEKVWPLNKNQWLLATNATSTKFPRSLSVVHRVRCLIKNFVLNWMRGRK